MSFAAYRIPNKIAPFVFSALFVLVLIIALANPQRTLSPMGPTTRGDAILGYLVLGVVTAIGVVLFFDFLHGEDEDSGSAEADSAVQYPTEEVVASSGRQRPSRRVLGFGGGGGRPAAGGATGEAASPATSFEDGDHPAESEGTTPLLEGQHRADTGPLRSSSGDEEVEFHAGAASAEERNITPDSPDASASSRLAWLDNLRCFLIVVVVCYHATGGFVGTNWLPSVRSRGVLQPLLLTMMLLLDAFFMPLFFFASGFVTPAAWERRRRLYAVQVESGSTVDYARSDPTKEFLRDRYRRIFIPFTVLFFLLVPLTNFFSTKAVVAPRIERGAELAGSGSQLEIGRVATSLPGRAGSDSAREADLSMVELDSHAEKQAQSGLADRGADPSSKPRNLKGVQKSARSVSSGWSDTTTRSDQFSYKPRISHNWFLLWLLIMDICYVCVADPDHSDDPSSPDGQKATLTDANEEEDRRVNYTTPGASEEDLPRPHDTASGSDRTAEHTTGGLRLRTPQRSRTPSSEQEDAKTAPARADQLQLSTYSARTEDPLPQHSRAARPSLATVWLVGLVVGGFQGILLSVWPQLGTRDQGAPKIMYCHISHFFMDIMAFWAGVKSCTNGWLLDEAGDEANRPSTRREEAESGQDVEPGEHPGEDEDDIAERSSTVEAQQEVAGGSSEERRRGSGAAERLLPAEADGANGEGDGTRLGAGSSRASRRRDSAELPPPPSFGGFSHFEFHISVLACSVIGLACLVLQIIDFSSDDALQHVAERGHRPLLGSSWSVALRKRPRILGFLFGIFGVSAFVVHIYLFRRFCDYETDFSRFCVSAGYAVFLIHFLVVCVLHWMWVVTVEGVASPASLHSGFPEQQNESGGGSGAGAQGALPAGPGRMFSWSPLSKVGSTAAGEGWLWYGWLFCCIFANVVSFPLGWRIRQLPGLRGIV